MSAPHCQLILYSWLCHISKGCRLNRKLATSASTFPFSSSRVCSLEKVVQQHLSSLPFSSRCCEIERPVERRKHCLYGCFESSIVQSHKMSINWEIRPARDESPGYCKCLPLPTFLVSHISLHF